MGIEANLNYIKQLIPKEVKLIAVSKTKPVEIILEAYQAGQRAFGENRPQEMVQKYNQLPKDIEWHMIGHLQTNKVKYIAPFVSLIQSVESLNLLQEINKEALKNKRTIDCLLEFHIAREESKFGLTLNVADQIINSEEFKALQNIKIKGVMGMASFVDDQMQLKSEFEFLKTIFAKLKNKHFQSDNGFSVISMGMSGDFELAISCGSTMVRIGTAIFGIR
jgi:PLP dependent protein